MVPKRLPPFLYFYVLLSFIIIIIHSLVSVLSRTRLSSPSRCSTSERLDINATVSGLYRPLTAAFEGRGGEGRGEGREGGKRGRGEGKGQAKERDLKILVAARSRCTDSGSIYFASRNLQKPNFWVSQSLDMPNMYIRVLIKCHFLGFL